MGDDDLSKSEKQKLKILYLKDFLLNKTDENHFVKTDELIDFLSNKGISAERKSIYSDIKTLKEYGVDIETVRHKGYRVLSRDFEMAEIKALIGAVQYSRFISKRKTREIVEKLKNLVSENEAKTMKVNKALTEKVKSDNEMVLIAIDRIMEAIETNKQISVKYYSWTPDKKKKYSNKGKPRILNPWDLCWNNTAYYCLASTPEEPTENRIFRVDKMDKISVIKQDRNPEGVDKFKNLDSLEFSEKHFSMFNGEIREVTLYCTNNMANVIIDRFGKDVSMRRDDDEHFIVHIKVAVSEQFFGWVFGLGGGVSIAYPNDVIQQYKNMAQQVINQ